MKKVTMRVRGAKFTVETEGFTGQSCRTEELQKLYDSLGLEVESDMETPEASEVSLVESA